GGFRHELTVPSGRFTFELGRKLYRPDCSVGVCEMTSGKRLALGVLVLPVLLISVDVTVLGFALPYLSEDLAPTGAQQLWIVDIYSFVLGGLLVLMGSLGDRIGRRKVLLGGAFAFGVAS